MSNQSSTFKLALICGGPSRERGISLNSARSVLDHLSNFPISIHPIYVNSNKDFYCISTAQLYSNTPADFDYKLEKTGIHLNLSDLEKHLKEMDLIFPLIHGAFGEDGTLQELLEKFNVPFVAHKSDSCKKMFNKFSVNQCLKENGHPALPQCLLKKNEVPFEYEEKIEDFFKTFDLQRAIVKPCKGGSSIGVFPVKTVEEALSAANKILNDQIDDAAIIEPFCEGKEFTIVVFQNHLGEPVALIPTEIELRHGSSIFDFRKKYLPTNQVIYHTPPRFTSTTVNLIRNEAESIFALFEMRDFVRLDGWLMEDGTIYFTDINPISGLEQNSFFFQQAAQIGLSHQDALKYVLKSACLRFHLNFPEKISSIDRDKKQVHVLFGGNNAERQVSLMSGTNVWLKLRQSSHFSPQPFFLDENEMIWELPYSYTLFHTVEEIFSKCISKKINQEFWDDLVISIQKKLNVNNIFSNSIQSYSWNDFLNKTKNDQAFVFLALHGGKGEDGTIQSILEQHCIPFNGSKSMTSALCMDKELTGKEIDQINDEELTSLPKQSMSLNLLTEMKLEELCEFWKQSCKKLNTKQLIIKPRSDGCSAGIVLLKSEKDFHLYVKYLKENVSFIPAHTFENQFESIEMSRNHQAVFILEPFIETDKITFHHQNIEYTQKDGWIELTVGVFEENGIYHSLSPSLVVAEGLILSLEEKFQGGTGVNLTPPPETILSSTLNKKIKQLIEKAAKKLNIQNYARLDVFFNVVTKKMILIEANTLPALTPSTVIYHQGLAEKDPLSPLSLLEKIILSSTR
ncbi:MAG: hypothetical protein Q8K60_08050 [Parachlamydiaceae bacterium]|nr:hypothetical protein [Parachlamydiaceae bacterium]